MYFLYLKVIVVFLFFCFAIHFPVTWANGSPAVDTACPAAFALGIYNLGCLPDAPFIRHCHKSCVAVRSQPAAPLSPHVVKYCQRSRRIAQLTRRPGTSTLTERCWAGNQRVVVV